MTTDHIKVSYGVQVRSKNALKLVEVSHIAHYIKEGNKGLTQQTSILRKVRKYDEERYRYMKTQLPFFSCSTFRDGKRDQNHFISAVGLILDLDFKGEFDTELYRKIARDPRIFMMYISPSGVGLKIMFLYDEEVRDAYQYTQMYKHFSHHFGQTYHAMEVIDFKNSDVSRISFLSYDPHLYYNPDALTIPVQNYEVEESTQKSDGDIPPSTYKKILQKLETRPQKKKIERDIDESIKSELDNMRNELLSYNIEITEVEGISYGAKICVKSGDDKGEVNVYYGKRGYSVVASAKNGTHRELNEATKHIIQSTLMGSYH